MRFLPRTDIFHRNFRASPARRKERPYLLAAAGQSPFKWYILASYGLDNMFFKRAHRPPLAAGGPVRVEPYGKFLSFLRHYHEADLLALLPRLILRGLFWRQFNPQETDSDQLPPFIEIKREESRTQDLRPARPRREAFVWTTCPPATGSPSGSLS